MLNVSKTTFLISGFMASTQKKQPKNISM